MCVGGKGSDNGAIQTSYAMAIQLVNARHNFWTEGTNVWAKAGTCGLCKSIKICDLRFKELTDSNFGTEGWSNLVI